MNKIQFCKTVCQTSLRRVNKIQFCKIVWKGFKFYSYLYQQQRVNKYLQFIHLSSMKKRAAMIIQDETQIEKCNLFVCYDLFSSPMEEIEYTKLCLHPAGKVLRRTTMGGQQITTDFANTFRCIMWRSDWDFSQ
jgi:hypothetical protein